jgi:hypothetical protein
MKTTIIKPPAIIAEVKEKKEKKYRVVILTVNPSESENVKVYHTSRVIEETAKKLGIDVYLLFLNGAYLKRSEDGGRTIHNEDDEEGFDVSYKDTIAIVRGGVNRKEVFKDLLSQLENAGIATINSRDCWEICSDKY